MTLNEAITYYEREVKQFGNVESYKIIHNDCGAGRYVEEHRQLVEWLKELKALKQQSHDDTLKVGDRVKFKTMGGWYNGGTIIDMEKMNIHDEYAYSCLVKVDELGYKSPEVHMPLPYYVRVLSHTLIKTESEE